MSGLAKGDLTVSLSVDERERLNEWAAEVQASVDELARRLVLRYLYPVPVCGRDELDERIGLTLLARAGQTGQIPADAIEKLRKAVGEAKGDLGLD